MEIKELIYNARLVKSNLDGLLLSLDEATSKGKHGQQDILSKRVHLAKSKLRDYITRLFKLGQGTIIVIHFLEYNESGNSLPQGNMKYYINITKEDATILLNFWASYNSIRIKILEIEEVQTSKTYYKL